MSVHGQSPGLSPTGVALWPRPDLAPSLPADIDSSKPSLYVIKPGLEVVDSGSPLRCPTEDHTHALDWVPDGRYVYLAGSTLVVARPGGGIVSRTRLDLPPNMHAEGTALKASPDGRHVLLNLQTQGKLPVRLLYSARLDDGELRPLAQASERMLNGNVRPAMQEATWSPDGRRVGVCRTRCQPRRGRFPRCLPADPGGAVRRRDPRHRRPG